MIKNDPNIILLAETTQETNTYLKSITDHKSSEINHQMYILQSSNLCLLLLVMVDLT